MDHPPKGWAAASPCAACQDLACSTATTPSQPQASAHHPRPGGPRPPPPNLPQRPATANTGDAPNMRSPRQEHACGKTMPLPTESHPQERFTQPLRRKDARGRNMRPPRQENACDRAIPSLKEEEAYGRNTIAAEYPRIAWRETAILPCQRPIVVPKWSHQRPHGTQSRRNGPYTTTGTTENRVEGGILQRFPARNRGSALRRYRRACGSTVTRPDWNLLTRRCRSGYVHANAKTITGK